MLKNIKGQVITLIATLLLSISAISISNVYEAKASIFTDIASITYLYKNRGELKSLYTKTKSKTKSTKMPKLEVAKRGKTKDFVVVRTKKHTVKIGWFSKKLLTAIQKYEKQSLKYWDEFKNESKHEYNKHVTKN